MTATLAFLAGLAAAVPLLLALLWFVARIGDALPDESDGPPVRLKAPADPAPDAPPLTRKLRPSLG